MQWMSAEAVDDEWVGGKENEVLVDNVTLRNVLQLAVRRLNDVGSIKVALLWLQYVETPLFDTVLPCLASYQRWSMHVPICCLSICFWREQLFGAKELQLH
jgi:hypothetical protein